MDSRGLPYERLAAIELRAGERGRTRVTAARKSRKLVLRHAGGAAH